MTRRPLPAATAIAAGSIIGAAGAIILIFGLSPYGLGLLALLGIKLALSAPSVRPQARPSSREMTRHRIGMAIPVFNEDAITLRACLASIVGQTLQPHSIVVVDDGSTYHDAANEADLWVARFAQHGVTMRVVRFEHNRGKRSALIAALDQQPGIDLLLCVDSDTVLDPAALEHLTSSFADNRVTAATGVVLAANRRTNLLTRLIDLRYANAFLFERAAYSALGSVLCVCGSLAAYRVDVVTKNRDDFLTQTFLGRPAIFGDDRRLTNYALLEGKVVMNAAAVARTIVPERLSHYLRQQTRWTKSFLRESLWAVRHLPVSKPAFWLSYLELATWLLFMIAVPTIAFFALRQANGTILVAYLLCVAVLAYMRSIRYFDVVDAGATGRERIGTFLLAPLHAALQLALIVVLRPYAIATLRSGQWGTRQCIEVPHPDNDWDNAAPISQHRTTVSLASTDVGD